MPVSKTAKASMIKQGKEFHVETTEEAIRAIRVNREAGDLHIGDMSRVDKLLAAYDKLWLPYMVLVIQRWNIAAEIPAQEEDPGHLRISKMSYLDFRENDPDRGT